MYSKIMEDDDGSVVIDDDDADNSQGPAPQGFDPPKLNQGKSWVWKHFSDKEVKKNGQTFVGKACNYCSVV